MKNNNKLVNKTVELSLLKFVAAGGPGVYIPPKLRSCSQIAEQLSSSCK